MQRTKVFSALRAIIPANLSLQLHVSHVAEFAESMDPTAISEQIDRILRSQSFATKSQLRKLLVILSKNMDSQITLKPDQVIKELWPEETRTKRSADVATEINRLRHALESYYSGEGKTDSIAIVLPNRSVTAGDGRHERRWIVAKPRGGVEDDSSVPEENPRGGLKIIGAIAALCAALGIVAYVSFRVLVAHEQPKSGRLEGSTLTIMNAEGKELWRKVFPEELGPDWYYARGLATRLWFGDLEGKGRTSVLFLYSPAVPQSHSSTLICYSDRGKEKWRWTPGRDLPELEGSPATYKTFALGVLEATNKRPPRIVVSSAHDIWWPNQIAILDSNGKIISEYWHSGRLDYMTLADLDGDGKEEIVAAGINNDYRQATLVALDPDRVFGASTEVRPAFQIHGMGVAQEKLRLLFPRSDLNEALFTYNQATEPTVEDGRIRLTVRECIVLPSATGSVGCPVWYEFDKSLLLISAYPGEEFRSAHAQLYRNGKDAHPFSAEEQAAFEKVRCLVGCKTEFVPVEIR